MKTTQLLLLLLWLMGQTSFSMGQSLPDASITADFKQYMASVYKFSGQPGEQHINGCLYAISDSSLTLVPPNGLKQNLREGKPLDLTVIPLSAIRKVSVIRKGKTVSSLLAGVGLGSLVGLISFAEESRHSKFLFGPGFHMAVYGLPGTLVGIIVGAVPKKVIRRPIAKERWKSLDRYTIVTQLRKPSRGVTVSYEPTTY